MSYQLSWKIDTLPPLEFPKDLIGGILVTKSWFLVTVAGGHLEDLNSVSMKSPTITISPLIPQNHGYNNFTKTNLRTTLNPHDL